MILRQFHQGIHHKYRVSLHRIQPADNIFLIAFNYSGPFRVKNMALDRPLLHRRDLPFPSGTCKILDDEGNANARYLQYHR